MVTSSKATTCGFTRGALTKVQHVSITQSPNQKRSGLANLEIGLASGTVKLPYISIIA
ncbi:PH domain-containing protein, partial [Shewanella sp. MBTL60-112-B1]|uniref:PH domain-containing protein n=1 Tax=Shewanella sp. MBTL60-112-B1 TaxID=2815916 RepID=UPI00218096AC